MPRPRLITATLFALASLAASLNVAATANVAASAALNATAGLNLAGVVAANLSAVAGISMLLNAMVSGKLGLPAGACGKPCPLALLSGPPSMSASLKT